MANPKQDANKKTHWYLLAFSVPAAGMLRPVSFMGSYTRRYITKPVIDAMREAHQIPENAVLLSVSYMGHLSKHEMAGTSDAVQPTKISEAFRQGLVAAHLNMPEGSVVNPYEALATQSQEMAMNATEWAEGFAEGATVRQQSSAVSELAPQVADT